MRQNGEKAAPYESCSLFSVWVMSFFFFTSFDVNRLLDANSFPLSSLPHHCRWQTIIAIKKLETRLNGRSLRIRLRVPVGEEISLDLKVRASDD